MARKEEIRTADAHEWDRPFSQAIAHGDTLYLSGQVGADRDGNIVEGGIRGEAEQLFDNIEAVLSAAGSSLGDVLKATVFLTDIGDYDAFNEVYAGFVRWGRAMSEERYRAVADGACARFPVEELAGP